MWVIERHDILNTPESDFGSTFLIKVFFVVFDYVLYELRLITIQENKAARRDA